MEHATPDQSRLARQVTGSSTIPQQSVPRDTEEEASDGRHRIILLADPVGVIGDAFAPVLHHHLDCPVVRARTVAEVHDVIDAGPAGELAMVSLAFRRAAPPIIRALRSSGWHRVLVLTMVGLPSAPTIDAVHAGADGVLRVPFIEPGELDHVPTLSDREVQIVRLVAKGLTNKSIAQRLSLSALTVKNHLARIGRKLGARDRAHIVAIAFRTGGLVYTDQGSTMRSAEHEIAQQFASAATSDE